MDLEEKYLDLMKMRKIQEKLSKRVVERDDLYLPPSSICGLDVAYDAKYAFASAIILSYPSLSFIESVSIKMPISFPYITGLFALRELKPIVMAFKKLHSVVDVVMVNGHGRAHPRKFGLACHFGLSLNVPTIGIAKKRLCGVVNYNENISKDSFPIYF